MNQHLDENYVADSHPVIYQAMDHLPENTITMVPRPTNNSISIGP
jgi:hypothetical protein